MNTKSSEKSYNVLARKYRPQTFDDLLGQDHMVQTLVNSFESGRIAQAWLLTGIRGVGKTTTARILARSLIYKTDKIDEPTTHCDIMGENCVTVMAGSHIDVIEIDAASNTSVENIRDIIEKIRYRPLQARYKVYIIDEVHMLSNQAFNALLKTLEEPPQHVKFIFATTEIQKIPLTIVSRCQRFDLRRIDTTLLAIHLRNIIEKEKLKAEDEALILLARAGCGSVRDSLSLLDQAIAYSDGKVTATAVTNMLGLSSRDKIIGLYKLIMQGKSAGALEAFVDLYNKGSDASNILTELADFNHIILQIKIFEHWQKNNDILPIEKEEGLLLAKNLSIATIERNWRILQTGIVDSNNFSNSRQSGEMTIIRLCYASTLPNMDDMAKLAPLLLNKAKELEKKITEPQEIIKHVLSLNPNAKITINEKTNI